MSLILKCLELQDLRTIVMYLGRLAPIFSQDFETHRQTTESLLSTLINLVTQTLNRSKLHPVSSIVKLTVSLFGTIGVFVHWIVEYQNWVSANHEREGQYQELISYLVELCLISLDSSVSVDVLFPVQTNSLC